METEFRTSWFSITFSVALFQESLSSTWRSTQTVKIETSAISDARTISVQIEMRRIRLRRGAGAGTGAVGCVAMGRGSSYFVAAASSCLVEAGAASCLLA